ncbi:dihydrolipoamide acetyltransferase family protein [Microbacterium flavum]|uniref:Dihydrolipoamide acetyltransferase component of pyruvate dehydrogenase complex n=1 Tax=Microbacterium flavum TaxID=415216 RepID=A0ABS5XVU8_9MICO|nr:dihydrolipoamide acetyltransferase family protein [Microbacterium flavum]MBT8798541.1 2-oxo acid dehydrogenase subunit E2 [Microbacterium flavum]
MISEFRLPDLGEGLPEAEIVQWLVAEGDTVTLNQPIAEVETAKAIVELPSPFAGTVHQLHADTGAVVEVGSPLIAIEVPQPQGAAAEDAGASGPTLAQAAGTEDSRASRTSAADEAETAVPNLVGYGAAPRGSQRPQRRARAGSPAASAGAALDSSILEAAPHDAVDEAPPLDVRHERPRSTPPVRQLAKQLGVDLALVEASGVEGIIRREDVERFAARVPGGAPASAPPADVRQSGSADAARRDPGSHPDRETRMPIRGVRKATAAAMVRSAFTAPHVTCFLEVDVTETTRLVAGLRADRRLADHRIGILAVVAKAVCLALRAEPSLNSRWDEEAGEIVQFHYVNLGIAAATERGLIVPNVQDAHELGLAALADAIRDLTQTARSGRAAPAALTGGTFSITNFGTFGVDAGTPILNPPEAGILGLGAVRPRPWEHEGAVALRDVMTLSLSFDHRLVDGEQGSRFLAAVGDILREPGRAMLLA